MPSQDKRLKYFMNGTATMIILASLKKKDCYSYEIIKMIEDCFEQEVAINRNTIYTAVYKLLDNQCIVARKEKVGVKRVRVYYSITPKGLELFEEMIKDYNNTITGTNMVLDSVKIQ